MYGVQAVFLGDQRVKIEDNDETDQEDARDSPQGNDGSGLERVDNSTKRKNDG